MKKYFRWHLFIRIFLIVAFIIFCNRIIAQIKTTHSLAHRIHENIAVSLERCAGETDARSFLVCAARSGKHDPVANLPAHIIVCSSAFPSLDEHAQALCAQQAQIQGARPCHGLGITARVELCRVRIGGEHFVVFSLRDTPQAPVLLILNADITGYIDGIWALRDSILIYMLPVILSMVMLLAIYIVYTVMRPIGQIETSLTRLTSRNLDQPLDLLPPFKEFERFVAMFEQLRQRLNQSFTQERRFAADASHELRTPLTILRGHSERLIAELPTGSNIQVRMRLISDEIERLIEITEKLLMLSRADANSLQLDMEPLDLSELVTQLCADAAAFFPLLDITSDIEPGIVMSGDEKLIHQLIYNLYSNAGKYNVENGRIDLKLQRDGEEFVLTIENPCNDIPADFTEKAFDRFYRGDHARGRKVDGVGLGLALCKEIARPHGATLEIRTPQWRTVVVTLRGKLA